MSSKKVLAAIMFTDITGFSAMMQKSERRATLVRNRHRSVFKDAHARFNGKILQYFGDGTLSIFESVGDAVECAVEMQIEFKERTRGSVANRYTYPETLPMMMKVLMVIA